MSTNSEKNQALASLVLSLRQGAKDAAAKKQNAKLAKNVKHLGLVGQGGGTYVCQVLPEKLFRSPRVRAQLKPREKVMYFPDEAFRLEDGSGKGWKHLTAQVEYMPDLWLIPVLSLEKTNPERQLVPTFLLDLDPDWRLDLHKFNGVPINALEKIPVID